MLSFLNYSITLQKINSNHNFSEQSYLNLNVRLFPQAQLGRQSCEEDDVKVLWVFDREDNLHRSIPTNTFPLNRMREEGSHLQIIMRIVSNYIIFIREIVHQIKNRDKKSKSKAWILILHLNFLVNS